MKIEAITDTILDETMPVAVQQEALRAFSELCSDVSGVLPSPSFDAWAEDSFLDNGLAINSRAAAHCVTDYLRTAVFLRGVHAALAVAQQRTPDKSIQILYAGCGPYATLLLPLLGRFDPTRLDITLLDYHQESLDSVASLITFFDYGHYPIKYQRADACDYRHAGQLHLIIAETMQKSLEQEPQLAVTANLAPQLAEGGIFIPEKIEVELCLAKLDRERELFRLTGTVGGDLLVKTGERIPLANVLTLLPEEVAGLIGSGVRNQFSGKTELSAMMIDIPELLTRDDFDAVLFTRIQVFTGHHLADYESEITLPLLCGGLAPIKSGDRWKVSYELGDYPKFNVIKV